LSSDNRIGKKGATALFEVMAANSSVTRLDVSGVHGLKPSFAGLMALSIKRLERR
jgi:hypothetical protein